MAGFGVGLVLLARPLALFIALYSVECIGTGGFSFAAGLVSVSVFASIVIVAGIWGCASSVVGSCLLFVSRSISVVVLLVSVVTVGVGFAAGFDSFVVVVLWRDVSVGGICAAICSSFSVVGSLLWGSDWLCTLVVPCASMSVLG